MIPSSSPSNMVLVLSGSHRTAMDSLSVRSRTEPSTPNCTPSAQNRVALVRTADRLTVAHGVALRLGPSPSASRGLAPVQLWIPMRASSAHGGPRWRRGRQPTSFPSSPMAPMK